MLSAYYLTNRNGNFSGLGVTAEGCEKAATIFVDGYRYIGDVCPKSGNLYVHRLSRAVAPKGTSGWKALRRSIGATVAKKWESAVGWSESGNRPIYPSLSLLPRTSKRLIGEDGVGDYNSNNDFYVYFYDKNGIPLDSTKLAQDLLAGRGTELNRATSAKIGIYRDVPDKSVWARVKDIPGDLYTGIGLEALVNAVCGKVADPQVQAAAYAAAAAAAATGVGAGYAAAGAAATTAAGAICGLITGSPGAPPIPVPTGATATKPPSTATATAMTSAKYAGGIAALDPKTNLYIVAMPTGVADWGAAPFQIVTTSSPSQEAATLISLTDLQKQTGTTPWYKKPMTYVIAGGVVAAGTGVYLWRRRK